MRRSSLLSCSFLTLLVACSDGGKLDPLGPPEVPSAPAAPEPGTLISDAVHGVDGDEHFFWLPPLVAQPESFNGDFDGSRAPVVEICEWNGTTCSALVATFTTDTEPGSETIRVVPEDEHYIVNWHTDDADVGATAGMTYRIAASADGGELGVADVTIAATGGEAKNLSTGETIGLKDGRTLVIKFRMEEGVPYVVSTDQGGTVQALDGTVTLDIPPNSVQGTDPAVALTVESVDPVAGQAAILDIGPDGTTFDELNPMILTVAYDESSLGGVAETDLAVNLLDPATGDWNVVPGGTVDIANDRAMAPVFHLSQFGVGPAAKAVVCPGDGNPNTFDTFDAAIAALMAGGTLTVCDGTHTVVSVRLIKAMTIEGKIGTLPTLTTGGAPFGLITAFSSGTLTIRNLRLETDWDGGVNSIPTALLIQASHDQVVLEDIELDVLPGAGGAVTASGVVVAPSNPTSHVTLRRVTQTGGRNGAYLWTTLNAPVGVSVDIMDSSFDSQRGVVVYDQSSQGAFGNVDIDSVSITADRGVFALRAGDGTGGRVNVSNSSFFGGAAIWYQAAASGTIQNNTSNCSHNGACIRIGGPNPGQTQPDPPRIIGNTIAATAVNQTQRGIWVSGPSTGTFEVTGNQVGGPAPSGDRTDPAVYSFVESGIRVDDPQVGGIVSDNLVSSAFYGIVTTGGPVKVSGLDNTVDAVWTAVQVVGGGQMSIQSSDFTDYIVPIEPTGPWSTGDLTCNWWGAVGGPVGVDPAVPAGVYTPWATSSVAGTGTTSC